MNKSAKVGTMPAKAKKVEAKSKAVRGKAVPVELSEKQKAFCREYIVDLNGTQAAIRAGYSKNSARSIAQENLTKPDIQKLLRKLIDERANRVEVTADTVLHELLLIARVDIGEAFDESGNLKNIQDMPEEIRRAVAGIDVYDEFAGSGEDRERIGQTKKIRFWDKPKALELLGRHLRLFIDKIEHSGPNGAPLQSLPAMSPEAEKEISDCMAAVRASLLVPQGLKPLGG